jgi:hypothetical protein
MAVREAYLENTLQEVEELAGRVSLLKSALARPNCGDKVKQNCNLETVRSRFAEFRRRVEELEEAPEETLESSHAAAEHAWQELKGEVESLLEGTE